ncbi:MAG: hypothetical protein ABI227_04280 [Rhodanobacter sp.]
MQILGSLPDTRMGDTIVSASFIGLGGLISHAAIAGSPDIYPLPECQ